MNVLISVIYSVYTYVFFSAQLRLVLDAFCWNKYSPLSVAVILLSFKLGEFVNEAVDIDSPKNYSVVSCIALIGFSFFPSITVKCFLMFLFGFSAMKIRDGLAQRTDRRMKFAARAAGFIASPLVSLPIDGLILVVPTLLLLSITLDSNLFKTKRLRLRWFVARQNVTSTASMGIHHFHYFAYAYSIPYMYEKYGNVDFVWYGLLFYVGWAAYNAYERLIVPDWKWIAIGHAVAGIALIQLSHATDFLSISFYWFITGLGGGTVYMLNSVRPDKGQQTLHDLKLAEGIGHVAGIGAWGAILKYASLPTTFNVAAVAGFSVMLLALYGMKECRHMELRS